MGCIQQKRLQEEMSSPSKQPRLEIPLCNVNLDELNCQSLSFCNINENTVLPEICMQYPANDPCAAQVNDPSTQMLNTCNNTTFCPDFTKDNLNTFFNNFSKICKPTTDLALLDEQQQEPMSHVNDGMHNKNPTNTAGNDSSIISFTNSGGKSSNSLVFHKELADLMFLSLKHHNRQYYVHIREFKRDLITKQDISTRNGIIMDMNSWYEFQYKIYAFNLKYKSSSFIANNTILVLNFNNYIMHIKNLKKYTSIYLNGNQLEKLKEMSQDLNKVLIQHMYMHQLPYLIKRKCTLGVLSEEDELVILSKLYFCIEENVLSILNRIYECTSCILSQNAESLHSCFMFNNRQKFQQLGDMVLILVDLEYVVSVFSNRVTCISERFLSKINLDAIRNVLFKPIK